MNKIVGFLACLFVGSANAGLIDFEDLDASSGTFVQDDYNGFTWAGSSGGISWVNNAAAPISGGVANSGVNFAWSNGGAALELSGDLFNIESLWISSLFGSTNTPEVTFEGFRNGISIFSTSITANNTSWTQAVLNFNGIDQLKFDGDISSNLLVDDISFSVAQVPEPSAFALLGLGLAGLGFSRKKKKA